MRCGADREIVPGTLGLRAPQAILGYFDLAQRIFFESAHNFTVQLIEWPCFGA